MQKLKVLTMAQMISVLAWYVQEQTDCAAQETDLEAAMGWVANANSAGPMLQAVAAGNVTPECFRIMCWDLGILDEMEDMPPDAPGALDSYKYKQGVYKLLESAGMLHYQN